jgi:cytoskeletal protein CcmA (bactofilin family)
MSTTEERTSVLGPSLRLKGDLVSDEDLLIQGQLEGSINCAGCVTIGATAAVTSTVTAQSIIVDGAVQGDLRAQRLVTLRATAEVRGNVQTPRLEIFEGAAFRGNIDTGDETQRTEFDPEVRARLKRAMGAP